jgi:hypothetical protein
MSTVASNFFSRHSRAQSGTPDGKSKLFPVRHPRFRQFRLPHCAAVLHERAPTNDSNGLCSKSARLSFQLPNAETRNTESSDANDRESTMRATSATITKTIDLTAAETPDLQVVIAPASRRMRDAAARDRAVAAFQATKRRRFARGTVDTLADAMMATGGLSLANVALRLNVGLPNGLAGIALGLALLGVGAALAIGHRSRSGNDDPGTAATPSRLIVLDEPARVITLDLPARHHAA